MLEIRDEKIPLCMDESGVVYIAGTRVRLECVAELFESGATAEEIAQQYDAIKLDDVYAVITYLLRHREAVAAYLSRGAGNDHNTRAEIDERFPLSLRQKLLVRERQAASSTGERLSETGQGLAAG